MAGVDAPTLGEIEISAFGPGIGESIVVHLGDGSWIVVDSCKQPGDRRPAAMAYLEELGVDVAKAVRLVVATHWHDDHVEGLAEVFDACKNAEFLCSDALRGEEFMALVAAVAKPARVERSAVNELRDVTEIIEARQADRPPASRGPRHAIADRLILNGRTAVPYEVHALSPSDAAVTISKREIAGLIPRPGDPPRRLPALHPNHTAIVLWLKFDRAEVLLGADLEVTGNPSIGWDAALATNLPKGLAAVVKAAHHGSENGHHAAFWTQHVSPLAHTLVTPYLPSKLPRSEQLKTIKQASHRVFVSSRPRLSKPPRRDAAVERTLREATTRHRSLTRTAGHVRLRFTPDKADPNFDVRMFGTAYEYSPP